MLEFVGSKTSADFLLPHEPNPHIAGRDRKLSERFLTPHLREIESFLLYLRGEIDRELSREKPLKNGKPYPLGQCLEITLAMQSKLRNAGKLPIKGALAIGRSSISKFVNAGGIFRQVWGDLRGEFFQNAFQLGAYYVDVSNDTVTITKPKVEILPFESAQFSAISDFEHYARIAKRYWNVETLPNYFFPHLAPYAPILFVLPNGQIQLQSTYKYMVGLAIRSGFELSERVLRAGDLGNERLHNCWQLLSRSFLECQHTLYQGRDLALEYCAQARQQQGKMRVAKLDDNAKRYVEEIKLMNRRMLDLQISEVPRQRLSLQKLANSNIQHRKLGVDMPSIQINNVQYDLDTLSAEAKSQIEMLIATDRKIAELQRDLAIAQTARNAYSSALASVLPKAA